MRVGKQFFLISINMAAQAAKQEKMANGFLLAPKFIDMKYNLQYGTILEIGSAAQRAYPGAKCGDTLVFKHIVEAQKWRTLQKNQQEEHNLVDAMSGNEVYAIVTTTGEWIVNKNYVFLDSEYTLIKNKEFSSLLSMENAEIFLEEGYVMDKIERLKTEQLQLKESIECLRDSYELERQATVLEGLKNEMAQLARFMHSTKYCSARVAIVHPDTTAITGITEGSNIFIDHRVLYELNLEGLGRKFRLAYTKMVEGIL